MGIGAITALTISAITSGSVTPAAEAVWEDAYARADEAAGVFTVGAGLVELRLGVSEKGVTLLKLTNKGLAAAPEYIRPSDTPLFGFGPCEPASDGTADAALVSGPWRFEGSRAALANAGGRPAVVLTLVLASGTCTLEASFTAYPRTPIIRMDTHLVGTGETAVELPGYIPFEIPLDTVAAPATAYWMTNAGSVSLAQEAVAPGMARSLHGSATTPLLPWLGMTVADRGGVFASLEYLGRWDLGMHSSDGRTVTFSASVAETAGQTLGPGERVSLPSLVLGVFEATLDDMSRHLYDWQYEYMWDLTNYDHYAKTRWATEWFVGGLCMQDQFTGRVAVSGMEGIENARDMGYELLWDDAGWTVTEPTPGVPEPAFWSPKDGPDFAPLLRAVEKQGMDWNLWIAGNPDLGQLANYAGSWGNFEWRTDAVALPDFAAERTWMGKVETWLRMHPRCAYHTCSGGGAYSHTFDIQRLSTVNYMADYGRSDETNYYGSLLDTPDKWLDIVTYWGAMGVFRPDTGRTGLTSAPVWMYGVTRYDDARTRHNDLFRALVPAAAATSGLYDSSLPWPDAEHDYDREAVRRNAEIYRYLVSQGVAGRWSYAARPEVDGDNPIYYFQRLSRDRLRSCIVLKHRTDGVVTIYPKGLVEAHTYTVGFESAVRLIERTGADLMARGITIKRQRPAEVIYLGLPGMPGNQRDTVDPVRPGCVMKRYETNLGHSGIGIYWSAGADDNWVSFYEVARDGSVIGRVGTGLYSFDRSDRFDIDAAYAVRTVDGDGNASDWVLAMAIPGEAPTFSALGGQFDEAGRQGWYAESTTDMVAYEPMVIVPHQGLKALEYGGNSLQPGGLSGVWMSAKPEESEGGPAAKVSRGWQTATLDRASVRTWIAPRAGSVSVVGRAFRDYYSRTKEPAMRVRIMHNAQQLWPESGWCEIAAGDIVGAAHNLRIDVAQGDALRFILDKAMTDDDGVLGWMPVIRYAAPPTSPTATVARILCGADRDHTDGAGITWSADAHYTGGRAVATDAEVAGAYPTLADTRLYALGRCGTDFCYQVSVAPAVYTVRLKLAETEKQWSFERPFNLYVNGARVLLNYDVAHAARGVNLAHERVVQYVVPGADGCISLRLTSGSDPCQTTNEALLRAIEILPQFRPAQRVNCGGDEFVDWNGAVWSSDDVAPERLCSDEDVTLATPTVHDFPLYQTASVASELAYSFNVPQGLYCVRMKFAEMWLDGPGLRPIDVVVNQRPFYSDFDAFTAAGGRCRAITLSAEDVTPDGDGRITVVLRSKGEHPAMVQAIEIE